MRISQKQNILYKDRMSHKLKPFVTETKFPSEKTFHETPLKRDSKDISFKGAFSFYKVKNYNAKKNLELLGQFIRAPKDLYSKFDRVDWADIAQDIKKGADGTAQVRTKGWTRLLAEGIVYPVAELPLHIANAIKKAFTGKNFTSSGMSKAEMDTRSWLQKKLHILNNSDIVNSFNGFMETAEKLKYDKKEVQSASILTRAMKMFDPKSGNYNGVHERALTRIVTGFIPAFFLANDAYNLSRICDDDPKAANKEKKTRFNQETKRVLSNAYLQLITLGALSKYINSKKWVFMLVTALSVIATESFSRLPNGKKIHFINKEQALKLNKEQAEKEGVKDPSAVTETPAVSQNLETKPALSFKGSKVFNGFGLASDIPFTAIDTSNKRNSLNDKRREMKDSKPLLSLPTITKWFIGMIAAGFAIKFARKQVKINGVVLDKYMKVISKQYDNLYSKLTQKTYKIKRDKFFQVVDKIKEYDPNLGQMFEDAALKYQKSSKLKKEAGAIAQALEKAGLNDLAQKFKHIANKSLDSSLKDIALNAEAEEFFKARGKNIIEKNINDLLEILKNKGLKEEAKNLTEIIFKDGHINTSKYTKAKKYIEGTANLKEFAETFENRFKVDHDAENLKLFDFAVKALRGKDASKAQELENLINNAALADELSLGKRNKPVIREIADFVTQPFKFIWGTITLPYKHVAKPLYNAIKMEYPLPQWDKEIDAVYNGVNKLTQKSKFKPNAKSKLDLDAQQFAKYMSERINKSFNSATMSSISNSDLSALAKNTSTAATAWFLLCDNHNMVMQKSNGNDKEGAVMKAKERAVQETSRTFYNVLFINLFNDTFRNTYNKSLFGAQSVNVASTLIGEYVNRKAIGMPVKPSSRDEILNKEYENITSKGMKGSFFRFMSRLTGKKVLSQRETNQKK